MNQLKHFNNQQGQTLVSFMISNLIGFILIAGAYSLLQNGYQLAQSQQRTSESDQRLIHANTRLITAIHHAGLGLLGYGLTATYRWNLSGINNNRVQFNPNNTIEVIRNNASLLAQWGLPSTGKASPIPHTDALRIEALKSPQWISTSPLLQGTEALALPKTLGLKSNSIVVIRSWVGAILLSIRHISNLDTTTQWVEFDHPLPITIPAGAMLQGFTSNLYYIGATTRHNHNGDAIDALYVQTLQNKRYELVPDIGQLHIDPAIAHHGQWDLLNPETVVDWQDIRQFQMTLSTQVPSTTSITTMVSRW